MDLKKAYPGLGFRFFVGKKWACAPVNFVREHVTEDVDSSVPLDPC